jgi:nucleotide-binding universal stress UspA family protein
MSILQDVRKGPVVIGFDGTPASALAVREAGALFAPRAALVVFVWEAGRSFEDATLPEQAVEAPGVVDLGTAFAVERAASDEAQQVADQGAALAREAGLEASALAVPHDTTVASTLLRLARESDAPAVVVGAHERHRLTKLSPSRTLADLLHAAPCPILVCVAPKTRT